GCQDETVVELLGGQGAARGACEQARLGLAWVRLPAGTLIRLAAGDGSNHVFQVEVVSDELTNHLVEQFRMARRVVLGAEAVHGVNQTEAEEVMPQAIDGSAGEPGVVAAGDPIGQCSPRRDLALPVGFAPVGEACLHPGIRTAYLDPGRSRLLL